MIRDLRTQLDELLAQRGYDAHYDEIWPGILRACGGAVVHEDVAWRYYALYTAPLLDAAGLARRDAMATYGEAQVALGLHLRILDWLIDRHEQGAPNELLLAAHRLLEHARSRLEALGCRWNAAMEAVYLQFLLYDRDVQAGDFHDRETSWRRVSPLCVLPDCSPVLADAPPEVRRVWRRYIAWNLMRADYDDLLDDLGAGRHTPLTALAEEHFGNRPHVGGVATASRWAQIYLMEEAERLRTETSRYSSLWSLTLKALTATVTD
jgi:hypothetical protein